MPKIINDEFTHLPISRQRKHQLRHIRDGLCYLCNRPLSPLSHSQCIEHREKALMYGRNRLHHEPWHEGGRGRPPNKIIINP